MIPLQIIEQADQALVSANWFFGGIITILAAVAIYFLKKGLDANEMHSLRVDKILEDHDKRIDENTSDIKLLNLSNEYRNGEAAKLADKILEKLEKLNER